MSPIKALRRAESSAKRSALSSLLVPRTSALYSIFTSLSSLRSCAVSFLMLSPSSSCTFGDSYDYKATELGQESEVLRAMLLR